MLSTDILRENVENIVSAPSKKREQRVSELLRAMDTLNDLIRHQELIRMALEECNTDNRITLLLDLYLMISDSSLEDISGTLERLQASL
ncbi:hypothetical protein H6G54_22165 [Anabaena cylindrica FACHB-243]|uniref:DNA-directed RNA polymerase omega subunit family protein-like protein n=1 Tax=Anabaena cylindrica (strain ATCC 27899 / PCC 7122) TaxID=272123 RepID=K9ZFX2_ANACC|nr:MULTISPECIES: hypothetical protein [Anabaena]AFZ57644.1 DNA-directed RNA polymerase omega subunit family protein-like protein [Anabaena cylindrica PCC 7122]AZL96678.1 DNA-directed RNA polymerase omega subunit family protein-like protein [Anabaena sp. CCAP 1446/1C]MBD2420358.1 hypothetical protein [Anabaena cylindrica FACHB-243]MBY5285729.1 hypothetical protein [Anabaena sp. CCAP 1446/1C]MBY5310518.1 hypothetical protein [Anabaena sp. CCAP 1446/1C]